MRVKALDHVNIVTPDLMGTAAFYSELLGLDVRLAPPPLTPENARWLFDDNGRAVIHVNLLGRTRSVERQHPSGEHTGAIHHIAFDCEGYEEMASRLETRGLQYHKNHVAAIDLYQLFVEDNNGVLLELNFMGHS